MSDNDLPEREMTLREWLAELPETHTANIELAALERELAEARKQLMDAACVMGSPKDAHRLADALGYVLASYRHRGEQAEAKMARMAEQETVIADILNRAVGDRDESLADGVARLERELAEARDDAAAATSDEVKFRVKWSDAMVRAELAESALAAARYEVERLRAEDERVIAELARTLAALSGVDEPLAGVRLLGDGEHLGDLAKRRMDERDVARAEVERAFRAGYESHRTCGQYIGPGDTLWPNETEDAAWSRYQQEREGGEGR